MKLRELWEKRKWLDPFTYVDIYLMPKVNPGKNEAVSWVVYIASAFAFAWLIYTFMGLLLATPNPMVVVLSGSMQPSLHRGDVMVMQGVSPAGVNAPAVELQEYRTLEKVPLHYYAQTFCKGVAFQGEAECKKYVQLLSQGKIGERGFAASSILFPKTGQRIELGETGPVVVYHSHLLNRPIIHRAVAKMQAQDAWYVLTKGDSPMNPLIDQEGGIAAAAIPVSELEGKAIAAIPFIGCFKLWVVDDFGSLVATGSLPPDFSGIC